MGMTFDGHACVTTTKGQDNIYEVEYSESAKKVWKLVEDRCKSVAWKVKPEQLEDVEKEMDKYMKDYNKSHGKGWRSLHVVGFIARLIRA
jgi:hypothetical protein